MGCESWLEKLNSFIPYLPILPLLSYSLSPLVSVFGCIQTKRIHSGVTTIFLAIVHSNLQTMFVTNSLVSWTGSTFDALAPSSPAKTTT